MNRHAKLLRLGWKARKTLDIMGLRYCILMGWTEPMEGETATATALGRFSRKR